VVNLIASDGDAVYSDMWLSLIRRCGIYLRTGYHLFHPAVRL
jgi:hypothetical protein